MDTELMMMETEESMAKALEWMLHEFSAIRTGKASPALVENIEVHVPSYGSNMRLKELALITTPEARLLMVQPFDAGTIPDIEKGLRESKLGINPAVDGKVIRLPIPELSEERRRDLTKVVNSLSEDGRVRLRACRKDAMDQIKAAQKSSDITEDQFHDLEKEIQDLTDKMVKEVEEHRAHKEKELMTV